MHLEDTIPLSILVWTLNALAMLGAFWFYRGLGQIFAQVAWFQPVPLRKWYVQIVLIGASIATYIMMAWSLEVWTYVLWFVLLCPPLFLLCAGFSVPVIVVFYWLCAFLAATIWPVTRNFAPLTATGLSIFLIPPALDRHWDRVMCQNAADLSLMDIQRPPFLSNVARIGSKSGREPYAIAYDGEMYWDWGYAQLSFVEFQAHYPHFSDTSQFTPLNCD